MALIVETGSGAANAESYASVAEADTYLAARSQAAWAALSTGDKEVKLRQATDYMQQTYGGSWAGRKVTTTQALDWPRYMVPIKDAPCGNYCASDAIPAAVKTACIMLALRAITGDLQPDVGAQKKAVKIGPIETTYVDGTRQNKRFLAVDNLLRSLLAGSPMNITLVRA